jgi:nitroreductase
MATLTDPALIASLTWRYAVKRFDPDRRIARDDWAALEQALVLSPSSYGLQPYRFLVIDDPALRTRLRQAAFGQTQVTDADRLVVFAARTDLTRAEVDHFLARTAEVRGVPPAALEPYRRAIVDDLVEGPRHAWIGHWAARQAYLALGNLLTAAATLGIDACPMEGFDPERYDDLLALRADGLHAVVQCALGYRHRDDHHAHEAKVRFPAAELIIHR